MSAGLPGRSGRKSIYMAEEGAAAPAAPQCSCRSSCAGTGLPMEAVSRERSVRAPAFLDGGAWWPPLPRPLKKALPPGRYGGKALYERQTVWFLATKTGKDSVPVSCLSAVI